MKPTRSLIKDSEPGERRSIFQEFEDWAELQKSGALPRLLKIFKNHQDFCYREALKKISSQQDRQAACWQAKGADMETLINLIDKRIKEVKLEVEGNDSKK